MTANGQKFAARSAVCILNGRSPYTWQIELIDQVTWCSSAMRTRPAQNNADSAPCQDQVTTPAINAGNVTDAITIGGKSLSTRLTSLSASRSGANRSRLDNSRWN